MIFSTNFAKQFDFHMEKNETQIDFRANLKSQSYKNSREDPRTKSLSEDTIKEVYRQAIEWVTIFLKLICNKKLIYRIYF